MATRIHFQLDLERTPQAGGSPEPSQNRPRRRRKPWTWRRVAGALVLASAAVAALVHLVEVARKLLHLL